MNQLYPKIYYCLGFKLDLPISLMGRAGAGPTWPIDTSALVLLSSTLRRCWLYFSYSLTVTLTSVFDFLTLLATFLPFSCYDYASSCFCLQLIGVVMTPLLLSLTPGFSSSFRERLQLSSISPTFEPNTFIWSRVIRSPLIIWLHCLKNV